MKDLETKGHGGAAVFMHTKVTIPWNRLDEAFLSVPCWPEIAGGYGFLRHGPGGISARTRTYNYSRCCLTYEEHAKGIPLTQKQVLLMLGTRNLGNNIGFVAYHEDKQPKVLHLADELYTRRSYACLCQLETKEQMCLALDKVVFSDEWHIKKASGEATRIKWAVSGQPLIWDGVITSWPALVGDTYDLRHIFQLRDNEDLGQTEEEKLQIRSEICMLDELTQIFVENLNLSSIERGRKICVAAAKMRLKPQCRYLHSAIGLRENGLILLMRHGGLEDIAHSLLNAGARRAILLDNGGSCGYYLSSLETKYFVSSTYFRPHAIGVIGLRLQNRLVEAPPTTEA